MNKDNLTEHQKLLREDKSLSSIRDDFHHFLEKKGLVTNETTRPFIEILEPKNNSKKESDSTSDNSFTKKINRRNKRTAKEKDSTDFSSDKIDLKKVTINKNKTPEKYGIQNVWMVNLELMNNFNKNFPYFLLSGKTPEVALLILCRERNGEIHKLYVCLIEMKSNLKQDKRWSCLGDVEKKFEDGMSKMYFLLTLNNHYNPLRGYENQNITVVFRGLVFYNRDDIVRPVQIQPDENERGAKLLKILDEPKVSMKLTVTTVLETEDKIEIKFFKNTNENADEMEVRIQDLIT
ncbi:MAG: hypothetical protein KA717_34415 [Woronichinia naegeliana WA131]|jgi:hypothetical protein|uniref:Uncharacterized protein n=1 Tax=Woronichinia naegeliana WA131 TaxID=2824559 RepID=A0A977KVA2_9CYAN|nr:MAG: hypothetical protein KA717_34415 [Woronichinia naegeliana WA131]